LPPVSKRRKTQRMKIHPIARKPSAGPEAVSPKPIRSAPRSRLAGMCKTSQLICYWSHTGLRYAKPKTFFVGQGESCIA
jgi:hypothetical protein